PILSPRWSLASHYLQAGSPGTIEPPALRTREGLPPNTKALRGMHSLMRALTDFLVESALPHYAPL
ncbi:hypothetical protein, partial [uncultured Ellagibacter sp.]|uniref:hypothetical protein n=1 Tax=uncultured Ellagibacter sp. TaxID=2137580 RepID=UPI0026044B79